jgi:hypothetical protein
MPSVSSSAVGLYRVVNMYDAAISSLRRLNSSSIPSPSLIIHGNLSAIGFSAYSFRLL